MALRDLCHPGALIYRAKFSKPVQGKSASTGEPTRAFQPLYSRWAAMETVSSRESVTNSRQDFSYSHRVVVRGTRDTKPFVSSSFRCEIDGRMFEVVSVVPVDRGKWIELLCSESA